MSAPSLFINNFQSPERTELFNLETDRDEFKNLAASSAYHGKKNELEQLLDKELKRQGETDEMILEGH